MQKMPYVDYLLAALDGNNQTIEKSFGRHVHWGYWETPPPTPPTDSEFAEAAENLSRLCFSTAAVTNDLALLDVGCGFGGTLASLNEAFTGMRLVGLNIDGRQLQRAKRQVRAAATNTVEFHQGDACALPFADGCFDVVLAVECIFHFPSREQFFREAARVLKPGGRLVLSDFVLHRWLPAARRGKFDSGVFGACDVGYDEGQYRSLAAQTGFVHTGSKNITQNTLPTYAYLRFLLTKNKSSKLKRSEFLMAFFTLLAVEAISRIYALNYCVFSFTKP